MTTKLEFLAKHPLFKELDEDELEELANIAGEYEYQDGSIVAYQGDIADGLLILKSGRLYVETFEKGRVTSSKVYDKENEYLGLEWLFAPGVHPATVRAAAGNGRVTRLIIIESKDFLSFLSNNQDAIDYLEPEYDNTNNLVAGFPEEVYEEALKLRAKRDRRSNTMNILPDELMEFNSRRSGYYLLVRLLLPLIGLLIVPLIPFVYFSSQPPDSFLYNLQFYCPAILSLFFIAWGIFRFLDWTNDYFIVTNRRVIHREFDLRTFRVDIKIARIDQIQSVSVVKPTLLANLLKYGTVRITTASQFGVIFFDSINHPTRVTQILEELTKRVRTLDASREQTMVRQSIEEYFQFDKPYQVVPEADAETEEIEEDEYRPSLWSRFYSRYQWRVEEGNTITYRKHLLVAMRALFWPMVIAAIITVASYLILRFDVLTGSILFPILIILYMITVFSMIWQIENWRNDLFRLTDTFIIDIDRLPFGFGESSKRAALENIQNVKAYTPGLIHTIFNYGFVEVETAGVESNIVFEHVPFPAIVQSDIFHQIEEFKRKQREAEESQRHKSFAVLLDVYKQEEEQGRLPRRTPPAIEYEEIDIFFEEEEQ